MMGRRQCYGDENEWTVTMQWQWMASDMQNDTRKRCVTHPSQQSTYVDSLGRSRREIETISGGGSTEKGLGGGD